MTIFYQKIRNLKNNKFTIFIILSINVMSRDRIISSTHAYTKVTCVYACVLMYNKHRF